MKKRGNRIYFIFLRYLIILLFASGNLFVFYLIFTPLTVYPSYYLLSLFYPTTLNNHLITAGSAQIEIIDACIAGSAYYLLFLLNLSVLMPARTRILSLLFSFSLFLVVNIARIFIFSLLYINNSRYFFLTHLLVWYILSGIIVFLVWLVTIKAFKIQETPFYTDLKYIYSSIK